MSLEEERLSAPTEALASFEPFVQWLLSASLDDLSVVPDDIFSTLVGASEDGSNTESEDEEEWATKGTQCQQKEERPSFETTCHARLALAETEGELEAAWDGLSCTLREWRLLDEKLLTLQEERDENCKFIELLERRIIKLLQDRDLAIAETYTIERQIKDAETFKAQQQQRERQQEEEQKNVRVALTLRKLLLRRSNDESDNTKAGEFPISSERPKCTEKDVQRLHKELADSKVAAAVAKAERDERRYAMRQTERRCVELKLALAQARAEEDDLQISLQQLTRARRNSLDHLQKISLFSAAEMPLQPPPAPTAGLAIPYAFSLLNSTGVTSCRSI